MTAKEYEFFHHNLIPLIHAKGFADSFEQLCFQMERIWNGFFRCDDLYARKFFNKSADKTLVFFKLEQTIDLFEEVAEAESEKELLAHLLRVRTCYHALLYKAGMGDQDYYRWLFEGEKSGLALSTYILSLFKSMQTHICHEPDPRILLQKSSSDDRGNANTLS